MKKFEQKNLKTSNDFKIKQNSEKIKSIINNNEALLEKLFSPDNNTFCSNFKNIEIISNIKNKKSFSQSNDFFNNNNRRKKSNEEISVAPGEQINNIFCINLQNNFNNIGNGNNSNININESIFGKKQIEEKEFNNKRAFQKEIMKKIFTKESGEIIDFLKSNNNNLRHDASKEDNDFELKNSNNNLRYQDKKIGSNNITNADGDLTNFQFKSQKFERNMIVEDEEKYVTPNKFVNNQDLNCKQSRNILNDNLSNKNSLNSVFLTGKSNTHAELPNEFPIKANKNQVFNSPEAKDSYKNELNHNRDKSVKISNFTNYNQNLNKEEFINKPNNNSFTDKIKHDTSNKLGSQEPNYQYFNNNNLIKSKEKEQKINVNDFNKSNFNMISSSLNPKVNSNFKAYQIDFNNTGFVQNNLKVSNFSDKGRDSFYLTQNPMVIGKKKIAKDQREKLSKIRSESDNKISMFSMYKRHNSFYNSGSKLDINVNQDKKYKLVEKILKQKNNDHYCPNCEHCNVISDENLEKHFNLKEAKNIIKKSLDYIVNYYDTDQTYMDFILQNNSDKSEKENKNPKEIKKIKNPIIKNSSHNPLEQNNLNNNLNVNNNEYENLKNLNKSSKFDIENLLNTYPKSNNDRGSLQVVLHFLDALVNEKTSLDGIAGPETFEKLKDILIMQGITFNEKDGELNFDQELEMMFDNDTKEKLKKLFKKKYANLKKIEDLNNIKTEEKKIEMRKRFMFCFLIFIHILSEIGSECKEKAVLLYRVFKLFFVEQERKWTIVINQMKEKITYFKELSKTVIQQNNKHLQKIEKINDILFANKLSMQNLQDHKLLINDLLNIVNEKRDQIYLLNSEKEILEKELNFWIYDFDKLKLNTRFREKVKELNVQQIVKNVSEEMSHKQISDAEKCLLINTDRFLLMSGHRNYFYQQKDFYLIEIKRITDLYEKCRFKKTNYKKKYKEVNENMEREVARLEKDIQYFREKLSGEKRDQLIQTDVDLTKYNKILKNNNLIIHQRNMSTNKLLNYVEKIKFNCSKEKPISKKNLLNLIPEMFNEKINLDNKLDVTNTFHLHMDQFFIKYMKEKFKLNRIFKKNTEQAILSFMKYSSEDTRIDNFRKFLGIGESRIRTEVLDAYLLLLKNLQISFYKLYEEMEVSSAFLMNLETCNDIYSHKFSNFFLHLESLENLLRATTFHKNENELDKIGLENKRDIYFLHRFHHKAHEAFAKLLNEFKLGKLMELDYIVIAEPIILANKDYELSLEGCLEIMSRNFQMNKDKVNMEKFFEYFLDKYDMKLKVFDFAHITLENFNNIFSDLEKKLAKIWDNSIDIKVKGLMFYKEFEIILLGIFGNAENKWKFNEYFKIACQSEDKDFLHKEEFISFCLNNKDILYLLIEERKTKLKLFK